MNLIKRILFVVFVCYNSFIIKAQINFNGTDLITITANQTGDDLRTFIIAQGAAAGIVENNDIIFNARLRVNANVTLTDSNAVYHFPSTYKLEPRNNCTINFTDVTIHYSGSDKGHSFTQAYNVNFTRVFFLQGVESGRSDFFGNGAYTFNMNDASFVSYGNDFLHFQTNATINNITIVNALGNLTFEPGARLAGEIQIINNLKLVGVTSLNGGGSGAGSLGDFKTYDMNWDATNWNFASPREVDFFFVNPIKPSGWTGYSGGGTLRVQEFYTHDVTLTDEDLNSINGLTVTLYNNTDDVFDYTETTGVNGTITQQEVLKIDNTVALNHDRGLFTLVVPDYEKKYFAVTRDFTEPIVDNLVILEDEFITETNSATVGAYTGITIDHTAQTVTISENRTLCEVYDYIKLNKLTNLTEPSISEIFATPEIDILDISNYQLILSGTAVLSPCDKFVKVESSITSSIADINNLQVGIEDATQFYNYISISNIVSADVSIYDNISDTSFLSLSNFTGQSNSVTQFSSADVRIDITRDGYTDWSLVQDFSGPEDIYRFIAYQAEIEEPASSDNQEDILFLTKKILMKNEGILEQVNGQTPNVTINSVNASSTIQATEER